MRAILLLPALAGMLQAQGIIQTIAGTDWVFPGVARPAFDAPLGDVRGIAVAPNGDLFVADADNQVIVKINAAGILTIVAGNGLRGYSGDGGPATGARLTGPTGVALDANGNLYFSDAGLRIRKVTPNGIITTIAGTGRNVAGGDGGPALNASFSGAGGVAVDALGRIYIGDQGQHTVRRIRLDGIIERFAGTGESGFSGDAGPATSARLSGSGAVAVDPNGVVYIADTRNYRVRRVSLDGNITTYAGNGNGGSTGDGGPATAAAVNFPSALALDRQGNLYVTTGGEARVRRITPAGIISTFAGGQFGYSGDGGTALNAAFRTILGVALDALGTLYICDTGNSRVRKVSPAGTVFPVAGNGQFRAMAENSNALNAYPFEPHGIVFDAIGNLYMAEFRGQYVRKISPAGLVTTYSGQGNIGFGGDGGPAANALFNFVRDLAIDSGGNLYLAEAGGHRVRKITAAGIMSTIAGRGGASIGDFTGDGGLATQADLNNPTSVAVDAAGRVYLADSNNHRIRRIALDGTITTFAGSGPAGAGNGSFSGDNVAATSARLNSPRGLAFDAQGNLHFSDAANNRIRRVTAAGVISTVVGRGTPGFSGDGGPALAADINAPEGIVFDATGIMYFADQNNNRIRRVTPAGIISTVAGSGQAGFSGDGGPPLNARLSSPGSLALDRAGILYFSDSGNDRIRAILPAALPVFADPGTSLLSFSGRGGGMRTAPQAIGLSASVTGVPFSVAVVTTSGGQWLSATPPAGNMPAAVEVTADPASLAPGTYEGTVTIAAPNAIPPSRSVAVRFIVAAPDPGRAGASADELSFAFTREAPAEARALLVSNLGGGTLNFSAEASTNAGGAWLSLTGTNGSSTAARAAAVQVRANPTGLAPGTYTGRVAITNVASNETLPVPVTMTVTQVEQTILLSQTGLTFTAVAGGGVVPPQTFGVLNIGRGVMNWSAIRSTLPEGATWLSITPANGASQAASTEVPLVEVGVDARGLEPGAYYGRVRIESPGAANSPQDVSIVLEVLPPGTDPGPVVRPSGLIFTGLSGAPAPGSQGLLVFGLAATPVAYAANAFTLDGSDWLTLAPPRATVEPARPTRIVVQPETRDLGPGVREGQIVLLFPGLRSRTVSVLFVLAPGVSGGMAKPDRREQTGCAPSLLRPVFTSLGSGFTAPNAWPTPIEVKVADDCGDLVSTGSVVASFSNGDPPLALVPLGSGRWSGTWQARNANVSQVILTATAEAAGLRGTVQIPGGLRSNPNPPVVVEGAVVSAASLSPRTPLAPGSIISIFGSRLAEGRESYSALPLETQLANATVTLGGRLLRLLYASEGQINAMIPYDVAVNTRQQLIVRRGSSYTVPVPMSVASAQPAIFTASQTGQGQGLIFHTDGRLAGPAARAAPGDTIVLYCAGLGEVAPAITAGTPAPLSPLSRTSNTVGLSIGGVAAEVLFAGLSPTYVGLYQVNARMPAGVAPGEAVVLLSVAGQQSPPVSMSVR